MVKSIKNVTYYRGLFYKQYPVSSHITSKRTETKCMSYIILYNIYLLITMAVLLYNRSINCFLNNEYTYS